MYEINRNVAIIKPKQPYVDWINSLPNEKEKITLEELKQDCIAILLPMRDCTKDSQKLVKKHYKRIFKEELFSSCRDDILWPKDKSYKNFLTWFEVEIHSIVVDAGEDKIQQEGNFYDFLDNQYTEKQGQYLSFIYHYTKFHNQPPSEAEMQKFFKVTLAATHSMVLMLEKRGFITKTKGKARSIRVVLPEDEIPHLKIPDKKKES